MFGVFIPDEVLADSRYKRGRRAETGQIAQHEYEDKTLEEEDFHATGESESVSEDAEDQGAQDDDEDGDGDDVSCDERASQAETTSVPPPKRSEPVVERGRGNHAGKQLGMTPVQRTGSASSIVSSRGSASGRKRARAASSSFADDDDDGDDDGDKSFRKTKKSHAGKCLRKPMSLKKNASRNTPLLYSGRKAPVSVSIKRCWTSCNFAHEACQRW